MILGIIFFNTGKFILALFGIKKEEQVHKDPNHVKTLDEIKNSREVTGYIDTFTPKAKRIGVMFWLVMIIVMIWLI